MVQVGLLVVQGVLQMGAQEGVPGDQVGLLVDQVVQAGEVGYPLGDQGRLRDQPELLAGEDRAPDRDLLSEEEERANSDFNILSFRVRGLLNLLTNLFN